MWDKESVIKRNEENERKRQIVIKRTSYFEWVGRKLLKRQNLLYTRCLEITPFKTFFSDENLPFLSYVVNTILHFCLIYRFNACNYIPNFSHAFFFFCSALGLAYDIIKALSCYTKVSLHLCGSYVLSNWCWITVSLCLTLSLYPLSLLVFTSSHVSIFHYHLNLIVYLHPMCLLC